MTKKHLIALADEIRLHNRVASTAEGDIFTPAQINALAAFCKRQNPAFNRERWLGYIAGLCGPNGGAR